MSGGSDVLTLNEEDVTKMLAATTHLGSENVHFQVSYSRGNLKVTRNSMPNAMQITVLTLKQHDEIRIRSIINIMILMIHSPN